MRHLLQQSRRRANRFSRPAFTLIELLVVILLVLILTTITVVSVNFSNNADRMRAGARQMQSLIGGARDRAIYANKIRGLRLLLDPNDTHAVSAVQYIGSPGIDTQGTLTFDDTGYIVTSTTARWKSLKNRGFLKIGSRIQIPLTTGTWFTVAAIDVSGSSARLQLNRANRDLAGSTAPVKYALELAPGILDDSQPVQFPRGVVIDLDGSQVPASWRPSGPTLSYPTQMDILFTPRGTIVGDCASLGMIHLHFADAGDVVKWKQINGRNLTEYRPVSKANTAMVPADIPGSPGTIVVTRDRILVTLGTRTGNATVHHVDVTNTAAQPTSVYTIDQTRIADDPFRFAETGEVANK